MRSPPEARGSRNPSYFHVAALVAVTHVAVAHSAAHIEVSHSLHDFAHSAHEIRAAAHARPRRARVTFIRVGEREQDGTRCFLRRALTRHPLRRLLEASLISTSQPSTHAQKLYIFQ